MKITISKPYEEEKSKSALQLCNFLLTTHKQILSAENDDYKGSFSIMDNQIITNWSEVFHFQKSQFCCPKQYFLC